MPFDLREILHASRDAAMFLQLVSGGPKFAHETCLSTFSHLKPYSPHVSCRKERTLAQRLWSVIPDIRTAHLAKKWVPLGAENIW